MASHQVRWQQLLAHPQVTEQLTLGTTFGIMAFHGGLEQGTVEIATAAAAASGASLYTVEQPADLRWHVASHAVDPQDSERLREFLRHVRSVVAIHGYGRPSQPRHILVGGLNRPLAAAVARSIRRRFAGEAGAVEVVDDLDAIPVRLRGVHASNPVNRVAGGGVQLELPTVLRRTSQGVIADAVADVACGGG